MDAVRQRNWATRSPGVPTQPTLSRSCAPGPRRQQPAVLALRRPVVAVQPRSFPVSVPVFGQSQRTNRYGARVSADCPLAGCRGWTAPGRAWHVALPTEPLIRTPVLDLDMAPEKTTIAAALAVVGGVLTLRAVRNRRAAEQEAADPAVELRTEAGEASDHAAAALSHARRAAEHAVEYGRQEYETRADEDAEDHEQTRLVAGRFR